MFYVDEHQAESAKNLIKDVYGCTHLKFPAVRLTSTFLVPS